MSLPAPPTYPVHEVKLGLGQGIEGKIVNVNLYANRADISRLYRCDVESGQNQVAIYGLPNVLDQHSIRVEGRGSAVIQDVTVSREVTPEASTTSPTLEALADEKEAISLSLTRCRKTLAGLDRYLESRTETKPKSEDSGSTVLPLLDDYNTAAEKYDRKAMELQRRLKEIETRISEASAALANSNTADRQRLKTVSIKIFAEADTQTELLLKYAVTGARWNALYDVRADTEAKEHPVEIVYKAGIVQSTAEDWTDVPVTLETATPVFGLCLPALSTWNLSIRRPPAPMKRGGLGLGRGGFRTSSISRSAAAEVEEREASDEDMGFGLFDGDGPYMQPAVAAVTSHGNVNATFKIPGLVSIPSDGVAHNITIVSLKPEAKLSWLAVPSVDTRVHLTSRITNTSEYSLLAGSSSVYVDGSFISKSSIPIDPSIRINHPPTQIKKSSTSGILSKTSHTSYTQHISVHNSKTRAIDSLKMLAHVPVSQDSKITVKLISPSLPAPASTSNITSPSASPTKEKMAAARSQVKVAEGVVARWYGGADEEDGTVEHLGKDGKLQWICALGAQAKVDLTLQWEVSVEQGYDIAGL